MGKIIVRRLTKKEKIDQSKADDQYAKLISDNTIEAREKRVALYRHMSGMAKLYYTDMYTTDLLCISNEGKKA